MCCIKISNFILTKSKISHSAEIHPKYLRNTYFGQAYSIHAFWKCVIFIFIFSLFSLSYTYFTETHSNFTLIYTHIYHFSMGFVKWRIRIFKVRTLLKKIKIEYINHTYSIGISDGTFREKIFLAINFKINYFGHYLLSYLLNDNIFCITNIYKKFLVIISSR